MHTESGLASDGRRPGWRLPAVYPLTGELRSLTEWGLIDEYRIYLHPAVLGQGTPFFAAARPRLRLTGNERIDDEVVRLTYVAA